MILINTVALDFSNWAVYKFLLSGIALWGALRLFKYFIPFIMKRKESKRFLRRYLPAGELFLWIIFILFSIDTFLNRNEIIGYSLYVLMFLFVVWFVFFVLRNIIAGTVFKLSDHFSLYDTLKVGKYSGRIVNFGKSSLELETENGKSIYIPYAKILNRVNIKTDPAEKISRYNFKLKTKKDIALREKTENIKQAIMVLPWSSIKKVPLINPIDEDENSFTFDITIYSLEKEYFHKIENNIKEQFSG